jgi:hypothetical protein
MTRIDHAGHLGGAIAGLGLARYWRSVDKQRQLRGGGGRGGSASSKQVRASPPTLFFFPQE